MELLILFGVLAGTYMMAIAKRLTSLVRSFRLQSLFLAGFVFLSGIRLHNAELFLVAALLVCVKTLAIPYFLNRIIRKIRVGENLVMFLNSQLSLFLTLLFTWVAWSFSRMLAPQQGEMEALRMTVAFSVVLTGVFIMMFRMKALAQVTGILVMENGVFLLGACVSGGMPFFVEIALFLDVFVSVLILNVFVYRINKMFTHIDVDKLNSLKG
jgi:hydrogenase-4 component E